ncbi:MAG: DUF436 family protein, partial [Eubacteriales bacterium]|nr:DUF436 family protein [Eubacteriales bacterium]MDD4769765.1 DUF436 family protein [Eubacteriales bacterium]
MIEEIKLEIRQVLLQLDEQAKLQAGDILVIGCSTSEVLGQQIGTASSMETAAALVEEILFFCRQRQIQPAFQCCEHLNRALVLERAAARAYDFDEVIVLPKPGAGGALGAQAMEKLNDPVVAEHIAARGKAGIDIGNTL